MIGGVFIIKGEYKKNSYNSYLKQYVKEEFNLDDTWLLYTDKYGESNFTTTTPIKGCKNCKYINGYPHFKIPLDICIREIKYFLENRPLYNCDVVIRYGDMHPNKPYPMLGQLRNYYTADIVKGILKTDKKDMLFTIGDISKKTIKYFLNLIGQEHKFSQLYTDLIHGNVLNTELLNKYTTFCDESINKINSLLTTLYFYNTNFFRESELYKEKRLYEYIKKLHYSDGINVDGEIKYFLQEFMFLLNPLFQNKRIVNIIGQDQSEHIKKVLKVKKDNNLEIDIIFIIYNLCKNASSRNFNEYIKEIEETIYKEDIHVNGQKIDASDFLRLYFANVGTDKVVDFEKITQKDFYIFNKIFYVLNKNFFNYYETENERQIIYKLSLINQVYHGALTSGNYSKIINYLYKITKDYNKINPTKRTREIYNNVTNKVLEDFSINKTKIYKKGKF